MNVTRGTDMLKRLALIAVLGAALVACSPGTDDNGLDESPTFDASPSLDMSPEISPDLSPDESPEMSPEDELSPSPS
jgi:hypothetical protein